MKGIFRNRRPTSPGQPKSATLRPDHVLYQPEAVTRYKAVIEETQGAKDEESLKERGLAFWMLGRTAKQQREYEDAARFMKQAALILVEVPSLRGVAVYAGAEEGGSLVKLERYDEALEVLTEVVQRLPEVPHLRETVVPEMRSLDLMSAVANSAGLKVHVLEQLGRADDADVAAEFVIDAFGSGDTHRQRVTVANAYLARGRFAHRRGDVDEALDFLDQAIALSENDLDDPVIGALHSEALTERRTVLQAARRD